MREKTFNKYAVFTKLFWLIFRPLFRKRAQSTESKIDDIVIETADDIISGDIPNK